MPFGIRPSSRSEGTYRVRSTYRAILIAYRVAKSNISKIPQGFISGVVNQTKRDEINRLSVEKSAFFILHS